MKRVIIATALLALAACKVEKTGDNTYQVETPSTTAARETVATATYETATATNTAMDNLKKETREVGKEIGDAARAAGQATGTAIEKAGQKLQEHSKKGNQ